MVNFADYMMKKRDRGELTTGLVLYGETEPPEMQIENLWKIVHRRTGEDLADPRPDFDEFSSSDRMYPSMMKPEVKRRWDLKNYEWEETKAQHAKLKRMVHAQFMQENPNLPVVQGLQGTAYGSEIQSEFQKMLSGKQSVLKSRMPKTGTGRTIRDELERDNVDLNEIADEVVQFQTPKSRNTFAALGVDRDETLRIVGKILASAESSHALEYQYDDEGRLQVVNYAGKPVEVYRYNRMGQRVFSQVSGGQPLKYHYNEHGQLVQAGDETYSYDKDGYLAGKKNSHGLTRYRYLENGQLCGVQLPDGREIEYRFGENGFRAEKLTNGKLVQRYHWDDLITLSAVENKSGVIRFRYDEDGDAIGMIRNGQKLLLATDQLGTVFTVADLSGSSVQEVLYDSFGVMIQNSHPELALPLGFAGGLYDSDTGLIHFGYREYDPATGRFISPDPLGYAGGDVDLYGYCRDDPVNFVDRLGLSDTSEASDKGEDEDTEPDKEDKNFYWTVTPKKNACGKCQALKGKTFDKKPKRPHPNCKCEIERHFKGFYVSGTLQGQGSSDSHKFGAGQKIVVEVTNLGPFLAGGRIQVDGTVQESTGHMAPGQSDSFEFTKFGEIPVPWEVAITCDGADNCTITYSIRG